MAEIDVKVADSRRRSIYDCLRYTYVYIYYVNCNG